MDWFLYDNGPRHERVISLDTALNFERVRYKACTNLCDGIQSLFAVNS